MLPAPALSGTCRLDTSEPFRLLICAAASLSALVLPAATAATSGGVVTLEEPDGGGGRKPVCGEVRSEFLREPAVTPGGAAMVWMSLSEVRLALVALIGRGNTTVPVLAKNTFGDSFLSERRFF